jgi:hypothetical protein
MPKQQEGLSSADLGYNNVDFPLFVGANLTMNVPFSMMNTSKDLDNLLKFILDALQMVVFCNDKFLYEIGRHLDRGESPPGTACSILALHNTYFSTSLFKYLITQMLELSFSI